MPGRLDKIRAGSLDIKRAGSLHTIRKCSG